MGDFLRHELANEPARKHQAKFKQRLGKTVLHWFKLRQTPNWSKQEKMLRARQHKAFREWLTANNEWADAKRRGDHAHSEEAYVNEVKEMEKRMDKAADAHEAAIKALYENRPAAKK